MSDSTLRHAMREFAKNTQKLKRISLWKNCRNDIKTSWKDELDMIEHHKTYYEQEQNRYEQILITAGIDSDDLCRYKAVVKKYEEGRMVNEEYSSDIHDRPLFIFVCKTDKNKAA